MTLTHSRLQEVLDYNPETGSLTWKDYSGRNVTIGKQAGFYSEQLQCILISIDKKRYISHRLAWFHYYGKWPRLLQHVDGNHTNNAIANLKQQNISNTYILKGKRVAKIYTPTITSEDIKKYEGAVNSVIIKYICKCFRGVYIRECDLDVSLGSSGQTLRDIQAHLMTEVFIALQRFNPNHVTPEGLTVKESTFIIGHLHKRASYLASVLTSPRKWYGKEFVNIDIIENPENYEGI
jgi:hypothetical protein